MSVSRPTPGSRHLAAAAWTLTAMLALAACSPTASASAPAESAAASAAASAAEPPGASAAASPSEAAVVSGDTTVTISGRSFGGDITVSAGSSVTFINEDEFGHTVTNGVDGVAAADALFDFSLPAGSTSEPIVFDTPGVYDVTCKVHPTMHMTITVV
jgi:plastocyanin